MRRLCLTLTRQMLLLTHSAQDAWLLMVNLKVLPPEIGDLAFPKTRLTTIYVPVVAVDTYKTLYHIYKDLFVGYDFEKGEAVE